MSICAFMPLYNDGAFVRQSIESLQNQSYGDFVVIINDDCSTDNTHDIVQEAIQGDDRFVFLCHGKNMGGLANENTLVDLAKKQYRRKYTFPFSGHDIISKKYFEEAVRVLESDSSVAMTGGQMFAFFDDIERNRLLTEAIYPFFDKTGLIAFLESAAQLGNCTIFNSVFRSDWYFMYDVFPIEEPMRGNDHLQISWMASYGYTRICESTAYFRRFFNKDSDHRPDPATRLMGVAAGGSEKNWNTLHRAMLSNYVNIFKIRFGSVLTQHELDMFSKMLFDILFKRFAYNIV